MSEEVPLLDILALVMKVQEAAYVIRDHIYDDDGEIMEMTSEEKDRLIYLLISYTGEYLALLGAHRTIAWDEIANYQIHKYPEYKLAVDGAQIDILNHIQGSGVEDNKNSSMFS